VRPADKPKVVAKLRPITSAIRAAVSFAANVFITRWGDADLNMLLDYVYFDIEPMENVARGESLKFTNLLVSLLGRLSCWGR